MERFAQCQPSQLQKPARLVLCAIFASVTAILINLPVASATPPAGWTLQQANKLMGNQTIYFRKDAIRIVNPMRSVVILMEAPTGKSPNWNVGIYNTQSKVFYETPLKNFTCTVSLANPILAGDYLQSLPVKSTGSKETCKGLPCDRFSMLGKIRQRRAKSFGGMEVDMRIDRHVHTADYFVCNSLPVAPEIGDIMQKIYKIPLAHGVPIHLEMTLDTGEIVKELETKSISRGPLANSVFEAPKNFKRVATEQEAVFKNADKDNATQRTIRLFDDWRGVMDREK